MISWKDYESKPTRFLVTTFQDRKQKEEIRNAIFYALVFRFRKDLLKKCEIRCARFGHGPDVAESIAENTFRSYASKGKFNFDEGKGKNDDDSFKIYLYGIARNELTNFFRLEERKRKGLHYDGSETIITELPELDLSKLNREDRIKYQIVQSLPQNHKAIYLTYTAYERDGCNLPKALRLALRKYCGDISQNTVRGYKKEAIDKINEGIRIMNLTINSGS